MHLCTLSVPLGLTPLLDREARGEMPLQIRLVRAVYQPHWVSGQWQAEKCNLVVGHATDLCTCVFSGCEGRGVQLKLCTPFPSGLKQQVAFGSKGEHSLGDPTSLAHTGQHVWCWVRPCVLHAQDRQCACFLIAEVQQMVHRFFQEAISNYSIFLVAPQTRTLYVGAKNAIFALPLESVNQPAKMVSTRPKSYGAVCSRVGACGV